MINPSKPPNGANNRVYSPDGKVIEVVVEGWCHGTRYIPVNKPTKVNEGGQLGTVYPASVGSVATIYNNKENDKNGLQCRQESRVSR